MIEWFQCLDCSSLYEFSWNEKRTCSVCNSDINFRKLDDVFLNLLMHWEADTSFSSSSQEILKHHSIHKIIELGKSDAKRRIIHLILKEIHEKPSHLFYTLHKITKYNPLTPDMAGNIRLQCKTWVDWGKREGLIWIRAKKGDIIEVIPSHYACEFNVGERFIVLGTLSGDSTAIVMDKEGKIGSLCFPEEYIVVDDMDSLYQKWESETFGKHLKNNND